MRRATFSVVTHFPGGNARMPVPADRGQHRRRSRVVALVATALTAAGVLTGCSPAGDRAGTVVVTTNILGDVVQNIAGDEVEVEVLMGPNADPHSFGISAKQAAALQNADLVVYNGLGLEEGVLRAVDAAATDGVATLAVGEKVDPLTFASDQAGEGAAADEHAETGDETGAGKAPGGDTDTEPGSEHNASAGQLDPHFWTDPARMRTAVDVIAARLIAEVPGIDAQAVQANAEAYGDKLAALESRIQDTVDRIPAENRALVTNHHVFGYFAERYGFEVIGAIVPSGTTLASPSASDLDSLASAIRSSGVPAIFVDSSQPDTLGQVLADEAGLDVAVLSLYSESLTSAKGGAPSYIDMMDANVETLARGLSP
ncbi:zinc/manganese transport system substrate-binding protein [Okibacterium fritillariae]|uniref:Zinc/manganese transport system substrate-binding protein n=1 Tax=Okibacterium fritillariae TaxID=123320 RepID=A0A1T5KWS4_9MICO|nr:zinc/manganese transport system substrate-binding protein [Okibacterium fritillariae]